MAEHQLAALLHDATEAYVGDLVRPIKLGMREFYGTHSIVSLYDHIEYAVWVAICRRFGLPTDLPACVHHADMVALATERRDLMPAHAGEWECLAGIEPAADQVIPLPPSESAILYSSTLFNLLGTTSRARASA